MPAPSGSDLFGQKRTFRRPDYEAALERLDVSTRQERAQRVRWLRRYLPKGGMLLAPDTMFVFNEAKSCFVDGHYIATILLSGAFAEHWMSGVLAPRGHAREVKPGLKACIACARKIHAWPTFVLDELERLQDIRNPFVHLKPHGHSHSVTSRSMHIGKDIEDVLRTDAEKGLGVIFSMILTTPAA